MASVVEICNLALSNIRAQSINSLDENSLAAQQCTLKYAIMRDQMLQDYTWSFAHKIKPLTLTNNEIFNWAYAYQYPADCMHINRVIPRWEQLDDTTALANQYRYNSYLELPTGADSRQGVPYEIFTFETRTIGINEVDARIDYRARVEDPTAFTTPFILALSYLLAAEIAIPIVGAEMGRALRTDSYNLYENYFNNAIANDRTQQNLPVPESEFVTIRK